MATLQKIRNRAGLLIGIIGFALLAFILGDLFNSGTTIFRKSQDKAFVINGEVISSEDYFNRVNEWEEFQKMVSGQNSLDENATSQIRELVYQQMVRERVLDNQAKKLGLTVSKEEMNDLVKGQNVSPLLQQLPFFVNPQTGMYDKTALMNFLSTVNKPESSVKPEEREIIAKYKSMWNFIENMIKYQRLEEKYGTLLSSAVGVNDVEAKNEFAVSQKNADMTYVVQNYMSIPDSVVKVSDGEIKKFYDAHREDFKMPVPMAKISYFVKEIIPSDQDFSDVEKQANEAAAKLKTTANPSPIIADYSNIPYQDVNISSKALSPEQLSFASSANINDVAGPVRSGDSFQIYKLMGKTVAPDSVKMRIIMIPSAVGKDSLVNKFVDSVFTVIKGGKAFEQVALELNPQSRGGDAGWLREIDIAQMGKNFVREAFSAPVGELRKVTTPGQVVLMKVEERTAPVTKYNLAIVNMPVLVSEKTSNNVDNELNQFVTEKAVEDKFSELASKKGYSLIPNFSVTANDQNLAQIPNSRQVIHWALNSKKMGAVKKFDLSNTRIIAKVENVVPAGYAPLSEVTPAIKSLLARDKKAEKIIADLKSKNINSLAQYASAMNSKVDTVKFVNFATQNISGLGYEPVLNAYSAFAPVNKLMGPVKGNSGVYVVNVTNRAQGNLPYNAKIQKEQMSSNNVYRMQMQSIEILKDKLKVKDNRFRFF